LVLELRQDHISFELFRRQLHFLEGPIFSSSGLTPLVLLFSRTDDRLQKWDGSQHSEDQHGAIGNRNAEVGAPI
jgi:hypothetical protein